jgi:hypothetical protein
MIEKVWHTRCDSDDCYEDVLWGTGRRPNLDSPRNDWSEEDGNQYCPECTEER